MNCSHTSTSSFHSPSLGFALSHLSPLSVARSQSSNFKRTRGRWGEPQKISGVLKRHLLHTDFPGQVDLSCIFTPMHWPSLNAVCLVSISFACFLTVGRMHTHARLIDCLFNFYAVQYIINISTTRSQPQCVIAMGPELPG